MDRTYAAKRLLEHGPLTFTQFRTITGWHLPVVEETLRDVMASGEVYAASLVDGRPTHAKTMDGAHVYRLTA